MSYQVGIDIGTTFTAAAVFRNGVARIFPLSEQRIVAPTMVARGPDNRLLVGWSAARQLRDHPERVVHSFKRRIGDRTPIPLVGESFEPSWFMAQILTAVVAEVSEREGGPPHRVALTHPANWNAHKIARLLEAISLAGLAADNTVLLSEPEAAAMAHATDAQLAEGALIAVYDLGGGSFDTAVLRRDRTGYEIVGLPEGIERLGGLDFDAALYRYAADQFGRSLPAINTDAEVATRAQLHLDCVQAKEALSFDPNVKLAMTIGGESASVTIERPSFEALIRPALMETIGAMRRCLSTARISIDSVSEVLLAGGSSQIPLVAELLSEEMNRPISIHGAPKELVAVGAAYAAARADGDSGTDDAGDHGSVDSGSNGGVTISPARSAPSNGNGATSRLDDSLLDPVSARSPSADQPSPASAPPPVPARPPSTATSRPPSLLPTATTDTESNGDGRAEESRQDAAPSSEAPLDGPSAEEWYDDAPRSLIIGILGALTFMMVLVAIFALRSLLGAG